MCHLCDVVTGIKRSFQLFQSSFLVRKPTWSNRFRCPWTWSWWWQISRDVGEDGRDCTFPQAPSDRLLWLHLQPTFLAVLANINKVTVPKMKGAYPRKLCWTKIFSWICSYPLVTQHRIGRKSMKGDAINISISGISTFTSVSSTLEPHNKHVLNKQSQQCNRQRVSTAQLNSAMISIGRVHHTWPCCIPQADDRQIDTPR